MQDFFHQQYVTLLRRVKWGWWIIGFYRVEWTGVLRPLRTTGHVPDRLDRCVVGCCCVDMGISKNGTPKSFILIGFSTINHPFSGTPILLETPIYSVPHTIQDSQIAQIYQQTEITRNNFPTVSNTDPFLSVVIEIQTLDSLMERIQLTMTEMVNTLVFLHSKFGIFSNMGVSKNRGGPPKSSIFNRVFHEINHPFWGTIIFGNTPYQLFGLISSIKIPGWSSLDVCHTSLMEL